MICSRWGGYGKQKVEVCNQLGGSKSCNCSMISNGEDSEE